MPRSSFKRSQLQELISADCNPNNKEENKENKNKNPQCNLFDSASYEPESYRNRKKQDRSTFQSPEQVSNFMCINDGDKDDKERLKGSSILHYWWNDNKQTPSTYSYHSNTEKIEPNCLEYSPPLQIQTENIEIEEECLENDLSQPLSQISFHDNTTYVDISEEEILSPPHTPVSIRGSSFKSSDESWGNTKGADSGVITSLTLLFDSRRHEKKKATQEQDISFSK